MNTAENINSKLAYFALIILGIGIFTSVSFSALAHVLIALSGTYFLIKERGSIKFSKSSWALIALIVIMIASVLANLDIIDSPLKNIFKAKYFVFGILGIFSFQKLLTIKLSDLQKKRLLNLFILATTLATVSGLIALYTGYNPLKFKDACHPTRACGVYGMYMTYGYGISLFCILLFGLIVHRKQNEKYFSQKVLIAAFIINFAGMYLSYARGGLIGFFIAVPFLFFKKNKKWFLSILVLSLVGFSFSLFISPKLQDAFFNRAESNNRRVQFFTAAFHAFKERPILGFGYKNFEPHVIEIKKRYNIGNQQMAGHAHNNFLEHLASTGILGLLAFTMFVIFWAMEMYYRDDLWGMVIFPFVIGFIVSGLFQYTFGDGENLFLIMSIYSLSQIRFNP